MVGDWIFVCSYVRTTPRRRAIFLPAADEASMNEDDEM